MCLEVVEKHVIDIDVDTPAGIKAFKAGYISEDEKRGDLLLKVHIDLPEGITEREEKLYEQILKIERKRKNDQ